MIYQIIGSAIFFVLIYYVAKLIKIKIEVKEKKKRQLEIAQRENEKNFLLMITDNKLSRLDHRLTEKVEAEKIKEYGEILKAHYINNLFKTGFDVDRVEHELNIINLDLIKNKIFIKGVLRKAILEKFSFSNLNNVLIAIKLSGGSFDLSSNFILKILQGEDQDKAEESNLKFGPNPRPSDFYRK